MTLKEPRRDSKISGRESKKKEIGNMDRWLLNAERQREYDDCYLYDYSMFPPEREEEDADDG